MLGSRSKDKVWVTGGWFTAVRDKSGVWAFGAPELDDIKDNFEPISDSKEVEALFKEAQASLSMNYSDHKEGVETAALDKLPGLVEKYRKDKELSVERKVMTVCTTFIAASKLTPPIWANFKEIYPAEYAEMKSAVKLYGKDKVSFGLGEKSRPVVIKVSPFNLGHGMTSLAGSSPKKIWPLDEDIGGDTLLKTLERRASQKQGL